MLLGQLSSVEERGRGGATIASFCDFDHYGIGAQAGGVGGRQKQRASRGGWGWEREKKRDLEWASVCFPSCNPTFFFYLYHHLYSFPLTPSLSVYQVSFSTSSLSMQILPFLFFFLPFSKPLLGLFLVSILHLLPFFYDLKLMQCCSYFLTTVTPTLFINHQRLNELIFLNDSTYM